MTDDQLAWVIALAVIVLPVAAAWGYHARVEHRARRLTVDLSKLSAAAVQMSVALRSFGTTMQDAGRAFNGFAQAVAEADRRAHNRYLWKTGGKGGHDG